MKLDNTKNQVYIFKESYDETPLFLTILFNVYVITWYLEVGKRVEILGSIRFEFLLGAFLGVVAVLRISKEIRGSKNQLFNIFLLYFSFLLLHLVFSYDFDRSWNVFYNRVIKFSFIALFIRAFVLKPKHLIIFIAIYILVFMKVGQEAFIGKITGSMVWENQGVMRLHGSPGTFYGHPSSLAGTALATLPFIYYLWPICSRYWRIPLIIQTIFAVNIIIFTGSRTSWVGTIVMLFYIYFRSKYKKKILCIIIAISFIGIPFIPEQYKERFRTIYAGQEKEGHSKQSRIELLEDSFGVFLDNPFGVGIGAFRTYRQKELGKVPMDTHCLYTEILSEIGIIGFLIFGLLIWKTMKILINLEKALTTQLNKINRYIEDIKKKGKQNQEILKHVFHLKFCNAVCSAVIVFVITRLGLGLFGHDLYEVYWFFASGVAIAIYNMNAQMCKRTNEAIDMIK